MIVFLHGLACTKQAFDDAFIRPEFHEFSIISFDFPGHGESPEADESRYSLTEYAAVAAGIIDRMQPRELTVVGHSMGGAVGILLCQENRYGDALRAFISVEGNLVDKDCGIVSRGIADQTWPRFRNSGYDRFIDQLATDTGRDGRAWHSWSLDCDRRAIHAMARELVQWSDSGKLLETFKAIKRAHYICGELTNPLSYLAPHLPTERSHVVPNSGHFPMIDNPRAFYPLISAIVAGTTGPAAISSAAERGDLPADR